MLSSPYLTIKFVNYIILTGLCRLRCDYSIYGSLQRPSLDWLTRTDLVSVTKTTLGQTGHTTSHVSLCAVLGAGCRSTVENGPNLLATLEIAYIAFFARQHRENYTRAVLMTTTSCGLRSCKAMWRVLAVLCNEVKHNLHAKWCDDTDYLSFNEFYVSKPALSR